MRWLAKTQYFLWYLKKTLRHKGPSIYLSGEGMHITDQKGRRYLEMLSSTTPLKFFGVR